MRAASEESGIALAQWLAKNEPALFDLMAREAATESAQLNGISDFITSLTSSVTTAAKSVGTYLTSAKGMDTLLAAGSAYLGYKTANNVLQTQAAIASAGGFPAPITNTTNPANGQSLAVYTPTNQAVTPSLLNQLQPSFLSQYGPMLALGGVGLFVLISLLRR